MWSVCQWSKIRMTDKQYPDLDPHQSERSNLIPHQSKRSDSDPYQNEKADPNMAWKTILKPFATDLFANVRCTLLICRYGFFDNFVALKKSKLPVLINK